MRASTLTADLVLAGLLLICLPSVSAFPEVRDVARERNALDEDAVEIPNYDLYGGPPPTHGAYDYVTITYGGYGPPPPPSSSPVISLLSSTLGQNVTGGATSAVLSSLPSGATSSLPPGMLPSPQKEISMLNVIQVSLYRVCQP